MKGPACQYRSSFCSEQHRVVIGKHPGLSQDDGRVELYSELELKWGCPKREFSVIGYFCLSQRTGGKTK